MTARERAHAVQNWWLNNPGAGHAAELEVVERAILAAQSDERERVARKFEQAALEAKLIAMQDVMLSCAKLCRALPPEDG